MPSTSEKQRIAAAIAEHHPGQLYKRNQSLLAMSKEQLHEFSAKPKKKKTALQRGLERAKA